MGLRLWTTQRSKYENNPHSCHCHVTLFFCFLPLTSDELCTRQSRDVPRAPPRRALSSLLYLTPSQARFIAKCPHHCPGNFQWRSFAPLKTTWTAPFLYNCVTVWRVMECFCNAPPAPPQAVARLFDPGEGCDGIPPPPPCMCLGAPGGLNLTLPSTFFHLT